MNPQVKSSKNVDDGQAPIPTHADPYAHQRPAASDESIHATAEEAPPPPSDPTAPSLEGDAPVSEDAPEPPSDPTAPDPEAS